MNPKISILTVPIALSENPLWMSFVAGNESALEDVYQTYFNRLYTYGYKYVAKKELVESALTSLFTNLLNNRKPTQEQLLLKLHLFKTLREILSDKVNECKACAPAKELLHQQFELELDIVKPAAGEPDNVLAEVLEQFTPRQREVLYLLYKENFSMHDIALIMHLSDQEVLKYAERAGYSMRTNYYNMQKIS
ncbi:RNA polymerase sigma factor [Chitinophagaceae bacterium LWZ2-11]